MSDSFSYRTHLAFNFKVATLPFQAFAPEPSAAGIRSFLLKLLDPRLPDALPVRCDELNFRSSTPTFGSTTKLQHIRGLYCLCVGLHRSVTNC